MVRGLAAAPRPVCEACTPQRRSWSAAAAFTPRSSAAPPLIETQLPGFDPLRLVRNELAGIQTNIRRQLGSGHPALATISRYYFGAEGKHVRPTIVLLMSQAINGLSPQFSRLRARAESPFQEFEGVDDPLSPPEILNDVNPDMVVGPSSGVTADRSDPSTTATPTTTSSPATYILPSQRRLAEITEMIHVASLLHDDVIDNATTRRSAPSAPSHFGNKVSILAGDFLLARASVALSRLGSNEVVELVASVLANLVEGEIMQMKGNTPDANGKVRLPTRPTADIFEYYLRKTYLKTASLIAKSARAAAILGGCGRRQGFEDGEMLKDMAYQYGRNLGLAFQLVDDMLDFTSSATILGKPSDGADLKLGLATAPALYAWEEHPEMGDLIARKFEGEGDVARARQYIARSSGIEKTAALAARHAHMAREALAALPDGDERQALEALAHQVLSRTK